MRYIYIDESVDLGDMHSSSRYFVMAAIMLMIIKNWQE